MNPLVILSPYTNQPVRNWPMAHFKKLAVLCVEQLDAVVDFVGSAQQRHGINAIVRTLPADRYRNRSGRLNWEQTGSLIRTAACVVSNNSGIGHYAADLGVPVVCLFAATHSPFEWMPRGSRVATMVRRTACSLCGIFQSPADCPHELRCLSDIAPQQVFGEICRFIAPPTREGGALPAHAGGRSGDESDPAGSL